MLDLSYLRSGKEGPCPSSSPVEGPADEQDNAYQRYLIEHVQASPGRTPMTREQFERYSLGSAWLSGLKETAKKVVQTCRLMVGIQDYDYYLHHMRTKHPGSSPLSREDFYRYCLDARFPGTGNVNKCPC